MFTCICEPCVVFCIISSDHSLLFSRFFFSSSTHANYVNQSQMNQNNEVFFFPFFLMLFMFASSPTFVPSNGKKTKFIEIIIHQDHWRIIFMCVFTHSYYFIMIDWHGYYESCGTHENHFFFCSISFSANL